MHYRTFSGSAPARFALVMSLFAGSAIGAQAAPSAVLSTSADARATSPALPAADTRASGTTIAPYGLPAGNDAVNAPRPDLLNVRPAALTSRGQRLNSELPAPAPRQDNSGNRTNTALMIVGAAAIVLGAAVGDEAGTVLIIGGAGVGLYGLYRLLN